MMYDFETTVTSIEGKVAQLIAENATLRTKVEEQTKLCKELQEALEKQHILINNLEQQNKISNLGNTLANKNEANEMKLKINQLIRTIDRSLSLLTKIE